MLLVGCGGLGGELRLPERVRADTMKRTGKKYHLPSSQGGSTQQSFGSGQRDAGV